MNFLTSAQKTSYDNQGFILLRNIFSKKEIEECSCEYDRLFQEKVRESASSMEATWKGNWKGNGESTSKVLSIHNLQCHSAVFSRMLFHENLLAAVADIIESPNILLHHTKAHIKPPAVGAAYPSHQDYHYFPHKNHSMVAVFINLDDSDPSNGGLFVFPGSHKLGPQENKSDVSTHFWVDQNKFPPNQGLPVYAKKGDVLIFSYLTVHASSPNTSDRNRRMLLLQLRAAEDEPLVDVHKSACQGMVLRGVNKAEPAEVVESENKDL